MRCALPERSRIASAFFDKGRICEQGAPDEIFGAPQAERTRGISVIGSRIV